MGAVGILDNVDSPLDQTDVSLIFGSAVAMRQADREQ